MEVLDATSLAGRLKWEAKEYWLHLEAETPLEKYPAKQHARRVQEKLGVEEGLIYLAGQQAKNNEDSDMPAPFRQLRYFYYLSGCNEPGCHLTYDIQHDTLSLFLPRIDEKRVIWNGRGSTLAEAIVKYDVDEVYYSDELSGFVADWFHHCPNRGNLYYLHSMLSSMRLLESYENIIIDTTSLMPAMNTARMIKDDHEVKLIQRANDISSRAHREVLANILKFKNEAQVEGLFLDVCVSQQAKQQAYDPIAASGPNAGTLHYDANNENFEDRQLMCLDAGCEYQLYASDITRTFPIASSWPSKEAENIYNLVERMQESCIERLAPGVRYLDLHILAHQIAIDGLLALGILHNGTKEEIYEAGTSRAFFPHGLGHHVGLEVHDVGQAELMSVRGGKPVFEQGPSLYPESFHLPVYDHRTCLAPTDPRSSHLEEGMVVTVEPGIYFSVYALEHFYLPSPIHSHYINFDVVQRYFPIGGVRIEDNLLITSKGYKNLTAAPKGDAMLEIIRTGNFTNIPSAIRRRSSQGKSSGEKVSLIRAPGIPTEKPESILKPITRASTMPVEFKRQGSTDFEPFEGPSLFSNFKRSMTTNERIQYWRESREREAPSQNRSGFGPQSQSLCGNTSNDVKHTYITPASVFGDRSSGLTTSEDAPACKNCSILVQTLDRLRANLGSLEQSLPRPISELTFMTGTKPQDFHRHDEARSVHEEAKESNRKIDSTPPTDRSGGPAFPNRVDELLGYMPASGRDGDAKKVLQQKLVIQKAQMHAQQHEIPYRPHILSMQNDLTSHSHGHYTKAKTHSPDLDAHSAAQLPQTTKIAPHFSCQPIIKPEAALEMHRIQDFIDYSHRPLAKQHVSKRENLQRTEEEIRKSIQFHHDDTERPNVSQKQQNLEAKQQSQAKQTLNGLKTQRRKYSQSSRCMLGTEQSSLSPFIGLEDSIAPVKESQRSPRDKLDELQLAIRRLEVQLNTYPQTFSTSAYQDSQQGGLSQAQGRHYWERIQLEEKLSRLRAKRVKLLERTN